MTIRCNQALIEFIKQGGKPEYLYFWGHQKSKSGISKSCFSQWYPAVFEVDGLVFKTAEHYMMYRKATLFNDAKIAQEILACNHPNEAKKLGRKVAGFDEAIWNKERFQIVVEGNKQKFSQNREMQDFLLSTGNSILIEASPVDKVWGIGLAADDKLAAQPQNWRGLNLLGYALMAVREQLVKR